MKLATLANKPKFYTKTGKLTPYALSCGYIEIQRSADGQKIARLYAEHGIYHVSAYDHDASISLFRFTTYSLTEARKNFNRVSKEVIS